eukprot:g33542.t1
MLGNIINEVSDEVMLFYSAWNLYCLVHYGIDKIQAHDFSQSHETDPLLFLRFIWQCSEQLLRIQSELTEAVKEVNKAKKKYWQMQRIAEITREKAAEAEAKSKKSEFGIFHSKTSLQKLSAK